MSLAAAAAIYSLGAIALTVGLVVVLHVLEPEFDPSWRLSEYSLGRYGLLMRVAFLAAGTGVIATAVAVSDVAWPWSIGLAIVAVGPLGAALVDADPITTPRAQMSLRSNVHTAFGTLFILGCVTHLWNFATGDEQLGLITTGLLVFDAALCMLMLSSAILASRSLMDEA